jgi:hypothetical protein
MIMRNKMSIATKEASKIIEDISKKTSLGPHEYRVGDDIIDDVTEALRRDGFDATTRIGGPQIDTRQGTIEKSFMVLVVNVPAPTAEKGES